MKPDLDPYVYPETNVLVNSLNIRDKARFDSVEYQITWPRRQELESLPVSENWDLAHLQEIHRRLFQDLFTWAGELRTVVLTKGSSTFYSSSNWSPGAAYTFGFLQDGPLLESDEISDAVFVENLAELLSRINYLHPFREGNGRTQRAFLDQVAAKSGRTLSWRNVGEFENTRASIEAFNAGNGIPLEPLIRRVMAPPLDGLSPFEDNVYLVTGELRP
ncbi:MAG: Fic family protein [Promicromonosporaceae bacterium]|nr:Fic family protein [Promicromonosporaceae bacterium]